MPRKDSLLLEEIYYVPEEKCFLMNKTGRIKQEQLYVHITPKNFILAQKRSSKLMYLPYMKGQSSTGLITSHMPMNLAKAT